MTGRARILVVDDDVPTQSGLVALLESAGYETAAACSYVEGLTRLRQHAPDLLITDVRLGEFNGLQLVVTNRETPAIVVTGFDDPVIEADARDAGAGYVVKPIAIDRFLKLVEEKLRGH
jgi:DNA-binding response OmpR family regulator